MMMPATFGLSRIRAPRSGRQRQLAGQATRRDCIGNEDDKLPDL